MDRRFVVISGCSGGGKSTLLDALAARGFATVPEPGRRIVAEERAGDGSALPWVDLRAFARRAIAMARDDLLAAEARAGPVFFDRGLVDAALALEDAGGPRLEETLGPARAYASRVFLAPPWPEIYQKDDARQHGFREAEAEFHRLSEAYPRLGYAPCLLPKTSVEARVAFVLGRLGGLGGLGGQRDLAL
jgi:predicted ATPase